MQIQQSFSDFEQYQLSQEKQEEFQLQNNHIEPWELRSLAIPGIVIGLLIAPFIHLAVFLPTVICLSIATSVLIYKHQPDFAKLYASSFTFIFISYFILFNLFYFLSPVFVIPLNCLLLAYTLGVLSITLNILNSDLVGQKRLDKRKQQIDTSYSTKYLRYKYFRQFWDSQLKAIVQEIVEHQQHNEKVSHWYSLIQSLDSINDRRVFLQRELDVNSSLISTSGLPLTEADIAASRDNNKIFTLQVELDTKIDTIIEEIDEVYSLLFQSKE